MEIETQVDHPPEEMMEDRLPSSPKEIKYAAPYRPPAHFGVISRDLPTPPTSA
jgi:hypothetical protein